MSVRAGLDDLETRVSQHNLGLFGGYTAKRRPVRLVYSVHFDRITDAIAYERQVKGWTRQERSLDPRRLRSAPRVGEELFSSQS
jgi:putative endonuclease